MNIFAKQAMRLLCMYICTFTNTHFEAKGEEKMAMHIPTFNAVN
jgi:hypothetical protein